MQDFIKAKIKSLPPLSDTTIKVQQICADPDGSLADLAKVVCADPMLTANILRSANSPLYGFSREINTVDRAVNLFGMVTIKGFALSAAMKQAFKINLDAYKMSEADFLALCTRQNALAAGWLLRANSDIKRVCIPASFLLEIGKLITASALAQQGKAQDFANKLEQVSDLRQLCELEREFMGYSSYEISALVFDKWALDMDMVQAIAHFKDPQNDTNAHILRMIATMSNCVNALPSKEHLDQASALSDELNLDKYALLKVVDRLQNA